MDGLCLCHHACQPVMVVVRGSVSRHERLEAVSLFLGYALEQCPFPPCQSTPGGRAYRGQACGQPHTSAEPPTPLLLSLSTHEATLGIQMCWHLTPTAQKSSISLWYAWGFARTVAKAGKWELRGRKHQRMPALSGWSWALGRGARSRACSFSFPQPPKGSSICILCKLE